MPPVRRFQTGDTFTETEMTHEPHMLEFFLNSLIDPYVFVDTDHRIRYMNRVAEERHGEKLIGTSIFDCHNAQSNQTIRKICAEMQDGLEEKLITDDETHRIYMRAVRDERGELLGYYERYEPPRSK